MHRMPFLFLHCTDTMFPRRLFLFASLPCSSHWTMQGSPVLLGVEGDVGGRWDVRDVHAARTGAWFQRFPKFGMACLFYPFLNASWHWVGQKEGFRT